MIDTERLREKNRSEGILQVCTQYNSKRYLSEEECAI